MQAIEAAAPEQSLDSPVEITLVTEANHRIANNLALIVSSVKARASEILAHDRLVRPAEVAAILDEISGRIATVGALHRLLSRVGETGSVDLAGYLDEVGAATLAALAAEDRVDLTWTTPGACAVPSGQALPIALVVAEVLTNTVKYAHPTGGVSKVWLGCSRRGDGSLMIDISDDGIGLPDGFDPKADGGLGLRTIRGLASQLGGQILFRTGPLGVGVTLLLPARPGHAPPRMELVT
ncbi:MAG: sensor histidine kinase [Bauldia sp.]|nr:sensor histidine kinase [Bauldia sp.]